MKGEGDLLFCCSKNEHTVTYAIPLPLPPRHRESQTVSTPRRRRRRRRKAPPEGRSPKVPPRTEATFVPVCEPILQGGRRQERGEKIASHFGSYGKTVGVHLFRPSGAWGAVCCGGETGVETREKTQRISKRQKHQCKSVVISVKSEGAKSPSSSASL